MALHSKKRHRNGNSRNRQHSISEQKLIVPIKRWFLALVSVLAIILFFSIPYYRMWLFGRIFHYYKQIPYQIKSMDIEHRLIERHGYDYYLPKFIHQKLPENGVLLLPPKAYVRGQFTPGNFRWHHIVWNYYFFGKQPLIQFRNAPPEQLRLATHAMVCEREKVHMAIVESPGQLQQVLASYKANNESPPIASTD